MKDRLKLLGDITIRVLIFVGLFMLLPAVYFDSVDGGARLHDPVFWVFTAGVAVLLIALIYTLE